MYICKIIGVSSINYFVTINGDSQDIISRLKEHHMQLPEKFGSYQLAELNVEPPLKQCEIFLNVLHLTAFRVHGLHYHIVCFCFCRIHLHWIRGILSWQLKSFSDERARIYMHASYIYWPILGKVPSKISIDSWTAVTANMCTCVVPAYIVISQSVR